MALSTENIVLLSQLDGFDHRWFRSLNELSGELKLGRQDLTDLLQATGSAIGMGDFRFEKVRNAFDKGEELMKRNQELGIEALSINDWNYPSRLREIPEPPLLLFTKGGSSKLNEGPKIVVAGSRYASDHGEEMAELVGTRIGMNGLTMVGGLEARGVDYYAHLGVLPERTIEVLNGGMDVLNGTKRQELGDRILQTGGTLLTPFRLGTEVSEANILERSRIQVGLSDGVAIVEAGVKSSAIQVARYAQEFKRPLAVYDHYEGQPLDRAAGNQLLLKDSGTIRFQHGTEFDVLIQKVSGDLKQGYSYGIRS